MGAPGDTSPDVCDRGFRGDDYRRVIGVAENVHAHAQTHPTGGEAVTPEGVLVVDGHDINVQPPRTGTFGQGHEVMGDGTGVHCGASEPRHDGMALPQPAPVFANRQSITRQRQGRLPHSTGGVGLSCPAVVPGG